MLKGTLINPELMEALAYCGHGSKILIADGNYPLKARTGGAKRVYLGLRPGLPTVADVLETLMTSVSIESAEVMAPDTGAEPEIFGVFRELLDGMELRTLDRYGFYDACCRPEVELAVSTGETRTFANILITVGCA